MYILLGAVHANQNSTLAVLSFVVGCGGAPQVSGVVTDVWGAPIEAATLRAEGIKETGLTTADGSFSFSAKVGELTFLVGKEGYINSLVDVKVADDGSSDVATVSLMPAPDHAGFFLIGKSELTELNGAAVKTVGTEIGSHSGVEDIGNALADGSESTVVLFRATLRPEELSRIDLQLHKLDFVESAEMQGILGKSDMKINLWTGAESQKFELVSTGADETFMITTGGALSKGVYAFHTQGMLTNKDVDGLDKLPEEEQVAYVFEVK